MNTIRTAIWVVMAATLWACGSDHSSSGTNLKQATKTTEDSLYELVISLHDEAMPKMNKLMGYQKTLQHQIDSLKALKGQAAEDMATELEILKLQLATAEKKMNDWMEQFEPDPQMPTTEERAKYFAEQEVKAREMKNAIFAALDSATVYIKPKP